MNNIAIDKIRRETWATGTDMIVEGNERAYVQQKQMTRPQERCQYILVPRHQ